MKIINNKNIFMLLILLVITVVSILSYYTYTSYNDYIKTQKSVKSINFIKHIDILSVKVMQERYDSALYLGAKGKSELKKVEESRDIVDKEIINMYQFLDGHKSLMRYKKRVDFIQDNLTHVRSKVDTLSEDYENIFFTLYHDEIIETLISTIELLASNDISKKSQTYTLKYKSFLNLKENIALENTYISFILNTVKTMNNKAYKAWDTLLSRQVLPDLSTLPDEKVITELQSLFDVNKFDKIAFDKRIKIFNESRMGKYTISNVSWTNELQEKINVLIAAQDIIFDILQNNLKEIQLVKKESLSKYAFALLFTFLLLMVLSAIYYNINKDKQLFEDTLKDIESVLNIEQQKELKFLIDNRKTNQIYKFLASTIREANETKDLFLANMSHEIRTPLNGIVGFTQLLKSTGTNAEQEEFISVIEHSSENLLTIVNDILDFSKIRANQIELEEISFDPMDRFESDIESYGARAAEKDIKLGVYIDPSLPTSLIGDPTKVSQILVNLLSNAIKFTDISGSVDITIKRVEESDSYISVKFSVEDTGIGISEEQKSKIFNEFSQADASTNRKFGGTGLGLAIASKFVSVMGGQLEIESEKNKGSVFFFTLKFNKDRESLDRIKIDKTDIHVGYLVPDKSIDKLTNMSVKNYVEYVGASFTVYDGNELLSVDKSMLPNILFINHQYCKYENELETYLKLDTKIILITTGRLKSQILHLERDIDRILYQPINFTKTLKSFDILMLDETLKQKDNRLIKSNEQDDVLFQNIHALVAEDNSINQKLIQKVLERLGVEVTLVADGKEACLNREMEEFDIIFMDIQMPVMNGMDATKAILKFERENDKKHIPIVALTANALEGDREKYIGAGMDNYMSKPLVLEKLILLLQEYFPQKIFTEESTNVNKNKKLVFSENFQNENIDNNHKIKEENLQNIISKRKVDILLYHPGLLMLNIYASKLKNLGYSVDVVKDEHILLDRVDDTQYSFVVYEIESLGGMECMIADIISDSGAKPFLLVESIKNDKEYCADILNMKLTPVEIKEILV